MGIESETEFTPLFRIVIEWFYPYRVRRGVDSVGLCNAHRSSDKP